MNVNTRTDLITSLAVLAVLPAVVIARGDVLFLGIWYYLAAPLGICAIGLAFRAKPLFVTGGSIALAVTIACYCCIAWTSPRPDGLLGLGHIFSLPGGYIGLGLGALVMKRMECAGPAAWLGAGFSGFTIGFISAQLAVCSTVMYCGILSFF